MATSIAPVMGLRERLAAVRAAMGAVAAVARRIVGVPDYDRYLTHHHACHAGQEPLTRDEFARQRLEARYNTPGSRCC